MEHKPNKFGRKMKNNGLFKKNLLLSSILTLIFSFNCTAKKGDFDSQWRGGEVLIQDLLTQVEPCGLSAFALLGIEEVKPTSDGMLITALIREPPFAVQSIIAKLNLDGSLNSGFGENGIFCTTGMVVSKMSISDDGSLLVAGAHSILGFTGSTGYGGYRAGQITPQGAWDNGFGINGISSATWPETATTSADGFSLPEFASKLDSNEIKVYGRIYYQDSGIRPVDVTFTNDGEAPAINQFVLEDNIGYGTVALANGDWYQNMAVLERDEETGLISSSKSVIRKFFASGELDINFGDEGELNLASEGYFFRPRDLLITQDQKLLISGYAHPLDDETQKEIRLIRIGLDGSFDSSFPEFVDIALPKEPVPEGSKEEVSIIISTTELAEETLISTQLTQTFINDSSSIYTSSKWLLALNKQGELLDNVFSDGRLGLGDDFSLSNIAIQSDGKLLLAGSCFENDSWGTCLKSMNWNNQEAVVEVPEVEQPKSGSGSVPLAIIYLGLFGLYLTRRKRG